MSVCVLMKLKIATSSKRDKPRNYKHLSQKIHTHFQKYRVFPIVLKHIVKLNSLHNVLSNHHVGHLGQHDKATHTDRKEHKSTVQAPSPCHYQQIRRARIYAIFSLKAETPPSATLCGNKVRSLPSLS